MLGDYVQDGLMLHYDAVKNTKNGHDKNATTWYDLSGNNNNGTLQGATWTEDGLYFDGIDDWVGIGEMNYDNVTIEVVMMNKRIDNNYSMAIICNCESGGYEIYRYDKGKNGMNIFIVEIGYNYLYSKENAQVNKKYRLSASYDNHEMVFYENNNKTTSKIEGTIGPPLNNTIMALGGNPNGNNVSGGFLNGTIYAVRIYNRALTDDEVMQNYKIDKMLYGVEDINE